MGYRAYLLLGRGRAIVIPIFVAVSLLLEQRVQSLIDVLRFSVLLV